MIITSSYGLLIYDSISVFFFTFSRFWHPNYITFILLSSCPVAWCDIIIGVMHHQGRSHRYLQSCLSDSRQSVASFQLHQYTCTARPSCLAKNPNLPSPSSPSQRRLKAHTRTFFLALMAMDWWEQFQEDSSIIRSTAAMLRGFFASNQDRMMFGCALRLDLVKFF